MDLSVFFAGTAGSVPSARRGLPALLIRRGGDRLLFDCGEGTQRQLVRSIGLSDLDSVYLTHLHADHWLGLPGMLKSFELRDRERPLRVYGPPGVTELMTAMRRVYGRLSYEMSVSELEPDQAVEGAGYRVSALPVRHRGISYGYALVEDARPGRFDAERARALAVAPGPAFGALQRGEAVNGVTPEQVLGPSRAGRRLVLSGDTAPCEAVGRAAEGADLLVHEATFAEDETERARATAHSTARQAAELARDARVHLLCLTHLSTRYGGGELREQARAIFPATEVPRDFDTVEMPLPERGSPELVRFGSRDGTQEVTGPRASP